ncbi:MAG: PD40 domain-containing protein [Sandaracinus sp.]|nr:PD40 domain-containing protein [Sandaracinus sp.]MCB9612176.1 PD40 domain-containing protein [Sandaracinus sp.]
MRASGCVALLLGLVVVGCDDVPPPGGSYFEERIQPAFDVGCAIQTNGCHVDNGGSATGNLDLSSYDSLMRREDTLPPYGPYSVGLLLLKGGDDIEVAVETWDPDPTSGERIARIQTDIRHNAGALIRRSSSGYAEIKRWIEEGHQRTGVPDETLQPNLGSCVSGAGEGYGFDPSAPPADDESYTRFVSNVQPLLRENCAGSSCHGNPFADLYLACGDSEAELRWNYFTTLSHVTTPVSTSGLLRRPLSTLAGGTFHEGGNVLSSTEDPRYQTLLAWAEDVATRRPEVLVDDDPDPGLRFFANRVQPVLVREGCMFMNCHSVAMFHELRFQGGDQGVFSRIGTRRNHHVSRLSLALESENPNDSRIIAKNLYAAQDVPGAQGMPHRGGSLFEDFSADGDLNPATLDDCVGFDADTGDLNEVPAYCVLARWHQIEREQAIARGEIFPEAAPVQDLVWVARPMGVGDVRDFDTFRGGADLRAAPLTVDADGAMTLGTSTSLLGSCGLSGSVDVRNPAVSWDGSRIAFAARTSASEPLRLYWMSSDGSGCELVPGIAAGSAEENGILIHDFDPAFAPDGRLVFASTRGNVDGDVDYRGPTRTPAAMQPNANLFVREGDGVRQLTFLLNQEVAPNFMGDGRLIFTTEKREPDFHQLALRRQNLDGGDYHPLFAQRASVGFDAATEVVELPNRNLAFVAAPLGSADGAGTIVVTNRSVGPDQADRPAQRDYVHSMFVPVPGALGGIAGVPGGPTTRGAFRSPAITPGARLVVSCDTSATDLSAGPFAWQLCELDPRTGAVRELGGDAGMANVEAVAVFARADNGIFKSKVDEVNGTSRIDPSRDGALLHFLDFPLLATLLFENVRGERRIDPDVGSARILEVRPPPSSARSFGDVTAQVVSDAYGQVFVDYQILGDIPLRADGSGIARMPAGRPFLLQPLTSGGAPLVFGEGAPFTGEIVQREQMQLYPGEALNQSMPRRLFNGLCGTCHGSISGRELDSAVRIDVLTGASRTLAYDDEPIDLR